MTDASQSQPKPPRGKYAGIMALTTALAVAVTGGVALLMGAGGNIALLACAAVAIGSFATFIPAIFSIERHSWGLAVLAASMLRTMLILAIVLFIDKTRTLGDARTALWIGAMCGAGIVLIVESVVSVRVLASMDRSASESRLSERPPAARA